MISDNNTYVFLSHSHHDFDKVSRLRNLLEAEGFKPLMFFLKAFDKPEYKPMLKPILKEEIDQRQRFILCRSENSRKSEWVRFEEDYIKSKNRSYEVIDLDASEDVQIEAIKRYRKRIRVFISYPRVLMPLVNSLYDSLIEEGFEPWVDYKDILPGDSIIDEIINVIDIAAKEGYVLYLIDCDCCRMFCKELAYAIEESAHIIPVIVSGAQSSDWLLYLKFYGLQFVVDVRDLPIEEQVSRITQSLLNHDLSLNEE